MAENPNGGAPEDDIYTITLSFDELDIELSVVGKTKTLDLPGDRMIFTYPGEYTTLTNLDDPSKSVTLNITGSIHRTTTTEDDGTVVNVYESKGRSVIYDPFVHDGGPGLVLARGNFSWTFAALPDGSDGELVVPLHGQGQLTDLIDLLI